MNTITRKQLDALYPYYIVNSENGNTAKVTVLISTGPNGNVTKNFIVTDWSNVNAAAIEEDHYWSVYNTYHDR